MNLKQTLEEERRINLIEIRKHQAIYDRNHSKRQSAKLARHHARLDEIERIAKCLGIKFEEKPLWSQNIPGRTNVDWNEFKPCYGFFTEINGRYITGKCCCENYLCPECKEKYSQQRIKVNPCSVTKLDNNLKSEPNDTANDTKLLTIIIGLWQRKQVTHLGTLLSPIKIN